MTLYKVYSPKRLYSPITRYISIHNYEVLLPVAVLMIALRFVLCRFDQNEQTIKRPKKGFWRLHFHFVLASDK